MTIAIILSTHGSVSEQLLKTTEMIVGPQKNIAWESLLPGENTETLTKKYSIHLSTLNINLGILFLVDTWGGTPFNAANHIILDKKNYDIITGVNIPMLIELCMARENVYSLKELVKIGLKYGRNGIKSVKPLSIDNESLLIDESHSNTNIDITDSQTIMSNTKNKDNYMIICLARIDDRLIHGQVVTTWAKIYKIQRIIVINDKISHDTTRKILIKQATPPGITAHIIDVDKAVRVYNNPKYAKERVMMLFTNPSDILRLVEKNIPITTINIGGMAYCHGKKQINNAISVDQTDINAFKKLNQYKIELEIRKIPSDTPHQIMNLIKKLKNNFTC